MATQIVRLKTSTQIPFRHFEMACQLFGRIDFDYWAGAKGYTVIEETPCKPTLILQESVGGDSKPDVECRAGLVITSAKAVPAAWDGHNYSWDPSKVQVGDVLEVDLINPSTKKLIEFPIKNSKGETIAARGYRHYMFIASQPVFVPAFVPEFDGQGPRPAGWRFEVFHSQREGVGPEMSTVIISDFFGFGDKAIGQYPHQWAVNIYSKEGTDVTKITTHSAEGVMTAEWENRANTQALTPTNVYRATEIICVKKNTVESPPRQDPLVFDLFGDGIHTVGTDAELHFDQNCDGFGELTGWVDWGSGMLMLDHNGNGMLDDGSELFGNNSILPDGTVAADGFAALSFYDTNGDGRIDADDPIWSELRMWQGQYSNLGHIGDPHEQGVLSTLDELGIAAINLDYTDTNIADEAGNTELRTGGFVWADGTAGSFAEYSFDTDMSDTVLVNVLEVSPEISALPQLFGAGTLRDLHQAMAQESDGELRALLEAFADETDVEARSVIFLDLLYKWTGAESVLVNALGSNIDARRVEVLNMIFGGLTDNGGSSEFQVGAGGSLAPSSRFRHPNAPEICQGPSLHTQTGHWPTTTIQFPLPPWRLPTTRSRKCRGKPMAFGSKCYSDSRSMDYISSTTHLSDEPKNIRSTARSRMNM